MKAGCFLLIIVLFGANALQAQKGCTSTIYRQERLSQDIQLKERYQQIEQHAEQLISSRGQGMEEIIRIPVVIHILYHSASEKMTDAQVMSQIAALNTCFRRTNADTINTPSYFKPFAADTRIEFQLATSDPKRRSTTGIIRKYTPITQWQADDKMKYASEMGDDGWDPNSYLNIWVCSLDRVAGYASVPGDDPKKDGIVIGFGAFGTIATMNGFEMGKTAVHEVGHWLNLKHVWGDDYCGDDGVADTPKQAGYNVECPGTVTVTCGNGPYGDMYMNYMDLTNDRCMNLFTLGQKARMRSLFSAGGARYAMLFSKGLSMPLIQEIPLPEADPSWLHPQLFPNPATRTMTLDLSYDSRWVGKTIYLRSFSGQTVSTVIITSKIQQLDISKLAPGVYFLAAKKDDGESMMLKFVKL
jgi:hypothetical protein